MLITLVMLVQKSNYTHSAAFKMPMWSVCLRDLADTQIIWHKMWNRHYLCPSGRKHVMELMEHFLFTCAHTGIFIYRMVWQPFLSLGTFFFL